MDDDLLELTMQLEHDILNIENRIETLKAEGSNLMEQRRKRVVQLAKITDQIVEEVEANQSWLKPEST